MKYTLLLFLVLTGCATANSDYWHGCMDTLEVVHGDVPPNIKAHFCDAVEHERAGIEQDQRFRVEGKR